VPQQVAHGDALAPAADERRKVAVDRGIELQLSSVVEHHRRRRGRDDLGKGGEVVDRRIGAHRRGAAAPAHATVPLAPDGHAAPPDDDGRARKAPPGDAPLDDAIDRLQPVNGHTNVRRRRGRESTKRQQAHRGDHRQHADLAVGGEAASSVAPHLSDDPRQAQQYRSNCPSYLYLCPVMAPLDGTVPALGGSASRPGRPRPSRPSRFDGREKQMHHGDRRRERRRHAPGQLSRLVTAE
jgi:hypothetical protein